MQYLPVSWQISLWSMCNSHTHTADASPAGLMVDPTFTTQNSLVFTWTLPPLGSESDITASLFTVTWRRQGGNPSTIVVPFSGGRTSRQGVAITNLTVGMPHDVWVIANYSTPMLDSDPAMATGTTLSAGQGECVLLVLVCCSMSNTPRSAHRPHPSSSRTTLCRNKQ